MHTINYQTKRPTQFKVWSNPGLISNFRVVHYLFFDVFTIFNLKIKENIRTNIQTLNLLY